MHTSGHVIVLGRQWMIDWVLKVLKYTFALKCLNAVVQAPPIVVWLLLREGIVGSVNTNQWLCGCLLSEFG